jgi:hypothetical protein
MDSLRQRRVLAIASGGGHWEQLMLLRGAFVGADVTYATTRCGFAALSGVKARIVPDCNRNQKGRAFVSAVSIAWLLLRLRPHVVVSTGALPGLFAVIFGKWLGSRTMWIDSAANVAEMSRAGRRARRYADRWLTQSPTVAAAEGAEFAGSVL